MAKNLVIVESPAKKKIIQGYLGNEFIVESSIGHIRDLPKKGGMSIDIENGFIPKYEVSEDKKKVVNQLKDAVKKANAVVLEPIMKVEVVVPEDFMGSVIGDLSSRRGKVQGTELRGELQGVQSEVPLSEMFGYATDVRSLTEGRATFTMEFSTYSDVPANIYDELKLKEV